MMGAEIKGKMNNLINAAQHFKTTKPKASNNPYNRHFKSRHSRKQRFSEVMSHGYYGCETKD